MRFEAEVELGGKTATGIEVPGESSRPSGRAVVLPWW